jgi:hypothetical protein
MNQVSFCFHVSFCIYGWLPVLMICI